MQDRTAIRQRYGIKGSQADDCIKAWCCGGMALMQHEKEVLLKDGQSQGGEGYRKSEGMRYEG